MKKMTKCAPNAPNGAHLCAKSGEYVRQSGIFYYINVRQIGGHKRSAPMGHKWGKNISLGVIQPTLNRKRERVTEKEI